MLDANVALEIVKRMFPAVPHDATFDSIGVGTEKLHRIVTEFLVSGHLDFLDWPYFIDSRYDTLQDLAEAISCG